MDHNGFNLDDAVAILERTPASLRALLAGIPERWVRAAESEDSWSPSKVIEHLIDGERTNWMVRARHILAGEQQPFPPFDRTGRASEGQDKSLDDLLAIFAELRSENIAALRGMDLTSEDLSRTGLHPELGEVRLGQLLATWVVHDLNHMGQIVKTMAKVYADAVGPWSVYLAILHDQD